MPAGGFDTTSPRPMTPAEEQRQMLEAHAQQAQQHIDQAEFELAAWRPVIASCNAGLEALLISEQPEQPEGQIAANYR